MADDAVIRLGYDNSKVRAGAKETETIMRKTASGVEKTMSGMGGKARGGADWKNVSFQIQDVAVQMQMGTKAATIFAQQGSQVASAFGPAGVAIGATIAVVGGLYTAGSKTNEMFDEMIKNVGLLKKESESLGKIGTLSEMVSQTQKIADAQEEMIKSMEKLGTVSGRSIALLGQATGGDSPEERKNQLAKGFNDLLEVRKSIVKTILELSGKEVQIEELKAQGNQDAVEKAQRELDLKRKIAQIKQQPFSDETKSQLIGNEQKKSDFEVEAKKRIKYEKEQQEEQSKREQEADAMAQAQQQYADAQLERITDTETGQEKVNRLTQEWNDLLEDAAKYSASSVQFIEKSASAQSKENQLLREKKKLAEDAQKAALSNAQFMDDFRARRQGIRTNEEDKAKDEKMGQIEFMNDFRVRRDTLRWQEKDKQEAASEMQSAFDGNRRKIIGYKGGPKTGSLATDTGRLSKDTGLLGGGTFDEFFKPKGKVSAVKNAATTNTRVRDGQPNSADKLLQDIRDDIKTLASY